jgi:hypothetical protein
MAETGRQETPSLAKVIQDLVEKRLVDVHTSMPCKVVSYDEDTGLAVVQPALKRKFAGTGLADLPTISNVPVCFPRMGKATLVFPVNPGDEGELHFAERSIDSWLTGGADQADDLRKHDLSDATFWPGLTSQPNKLKRKGKKTSAELRYNEQWIELLGNGKFKIANGKAELLNLIYRLILSLEGEPFVLNKATLAEIKLKLETMTEVTL